MSVTLDQQVIRLSAPCRVEDAEPLVAMLQADRSRSVDLTKAGHLHAAVFQVLLAFQPLVVGPPADAFVTAWLMSLLRPEPAK